MSNWNGYEPLTEDGIDIECEDLETWEVLVGKRPVALDDRHHKIGRLLATISALKADREEFSEAMVKEEKRARIAEAEVRRMEALCDAYEDTAQRLEVERDRLLAWVAERGCERPCISRDAYSYAGSVVGSPCGTCPPCKARAAIRSPEDTDTDTLSTDTENHSNRDTDTAKAQQLRDADTDTDALSAILADTDTEGE